MHQHVNIALQVIPRANGKDIYPIIDKAIEVIKNSGIKYRVCPFETVMEGNYGTIIDIIKKAQEACYAAGADEVFTNIKIQSKKDAPVLIEEKMKQYD